MRSQQPEQSRNGFVRGNHGLPPNTDSNPPIMNFAPSVGHVHLSYSLLCDDVRLEAGNKLSIMGIFQDIYLPSLPSTVLRFALVNHWVGQGRHQTQIQLLSPGRGKTLMKTNPSKFSLDPRSFADNVTLFNNLGFAEYGTHILQVYLDGFMVKELPVNVLKPPTSSTRVN